MDLTNMRYRLVFTLLPLLLVCVGSSANELANEQKEWLSSYMDYLTTDKQMTYDRMRYFHGSHHVPEAGLIRSVLCSPDIDKDLLKTCIKRVAEIVKKPSHVSEYFVWLRGLINEDEKWFVNAYELKDKGEYQPYYQIHVSLGEVKLLFHSQTAPQMYDVLGRLRLVEINGKSITSLYNSGLKNQLIRLSSNFDKDSEKVNEEPIPTQPLELCNAHLTDSRIVHSGSGASILLPKKWVTMNNQEQIESMGFGPEILVRESDKDEKDAKRFVDDTIFAIRPIRSIFWKPPSISVLRYDSPLPSRRELLLRITEQARNHLPKVKELLAGAQIIGDYNSPRLIFRYGSQDEIILFLTVWVVEAESEYFIIVANWSETDLGILSEIERIAHSFQHASLAASTNEIDCN